MEALVAEVDSAIKIMYGMAVGRPGFGQQDALQWLLSFTEKQEAWLAFPALFSSPSQQVRFYSANGIYSKILLEWAGLSLENKAAVSQHLWGALQASLQQQGQFDLVTARRVCVALAAAAVLDKAPGSVHSFVEKAASFCALPQQQQGQDEAQQQRLAAAGATVAMELLKALPEEMGSRKLLRKQEERVREELHSNLHSVLGLQATLLSDASSALNVTSLMGHLQQTISSLAAGTLSSAEAVVSILTARQSAVTACLLCMAQWLQQGCSAGTLYSKHSKLYLAMLEALLGSISVVAQASAVPSGSPAAAAVGSLVSPSAGLLAACAESVRAMYQVRTLPREAGWDDSLAISGSLLLSAAPAILTCVDAFSSNPALGGGGAGETPLHSILQVFETLTTRETDLFVHSGGSSAGSSSGAGASAGAAGLASSPLVPQSGAADGSGGSKLGVALPLRPLHLHSFPAVLRVADALAPGQTLPITAEGTLEPTYLHLIRIQGQPATLSVYLIAFMLQLGSAGDIDAAEKALAVFNTVQFVPLSQRHPYFQRTVFRELVGTIVRQSTHRSTADAVVAKDFLFYRCDRSAVTDILLDCCALLQQDFLEAFLLYIEEAAGTGRAAGIAGAAGASASASILPLHEMWRPLEAVCTSCVPAESDLLDFLLDASTPAATAAAVQSKLLSILMAVLESPFLGSGGSGAGGAGGGAPGAAGSSYSSSVLSIDLLCSFSHLIGKLSKWLKRLCDQSEALLQYEVIALSPHSTAAAGVASPAAGSLSSSPHMPQARQTAGISSKLLIQRILLVLLQSLQTFPRRSRYCAAPKKDTLKSILAAVGIVEGSRGHKAESLSSAVAGQGSDDDDDSDGDEEGGAEDNRGGLASGVAAISAAYALSTFCSACRSGLLEPSFLELLGNALQAAAAAGLPLKAFVELQGPLINLALSFQDTAFRQTALQFLLQGSLTKLTTAATELLGLEAGSSAAPASSSSAAKAACEASLCREIVFLIKSFERARSFRPSTATATGGLAGGMAVSSQWRVPEHLSSLQFAVEPCWSIALSILQQLPHRKDLVSCSAMLLENCLKMSPHWAFAGLPALTTAAQQLFQQQLNPAALTLSAAALRSVPALQERAFLDAAGMQRSAACETMPAELPAFCSQLALAATNALLHHQQQQQQQQLGRAVQQEELPEVLCEYYRLLREVLDACPAAIVSAPLLNAALSFLPVSLSCGQRDFMKPAVEWVNLLFDRTEAEAKGGVRGVAESAGGGVVAQVAGLLEALNTAFSGQAPAILKALAEAMVDEGSSQVVLSSIADLLHTIFLRFASAGASELFLNAILAIWSGKVGHAGSAEREKALAAAAGEAVADESTGLACLTVQDMQNVVLQLAAAAPSSYHSFKSLFNAVSKVCKGQQTKDFLQDYLTK